MFNFFYLYFQTRKPWLLLIISACILEIIAIYFQYYMGFKPCVLCIYERITLLVILVAGLIAIVAPKKVFFRYTALILWLYGSCQGLKLTWKHVQLKLYPSPFDLCDFIVNLPSWLPLNHWFPAIFEAHSDCIQKQWSFLNIEISVWLLVIFITYFLLATIVLLSQIYGLSKITIN